MHLVVRIGEHRERYLRTACGEFHAPPIPSAHNVVENPSQSKLFAATTIALSTSV